MRKNDLATVVGISALAFVAACVTHEAIGHGGMCLASGGRIVLISSVYFRSENTGPGTDAAGPMANLILGGLLFLWLKCRKPTSPHLRFFVVTTMALNLFWGSGVFIYSGISKTDDWAFVFRGRPPPAVWLWQAILILIGFFTYRLSVRIAGAALSEFGDGAADARSSRPLLRLSTSMYVSAGIVCCLAIVPFRGESGPALRMSLWQSFGGFVGLLVIANRRTSAAPRIENAPSTIGRSWNWIVVSLACVALFFAVMGRGYQP